MSGEHLEKGPSVETVRQRAIDVLTEHFSNDNIDLAGFERVNRCSTAVEHREILRALPPIESSEPATAVLPARGGGPVVIDADRVWDNGFLISVLGGTNRAGRWIPARTNFVIGVLGGLSLDFWESLLGPGVTELNVLSVLGGVEIIVPPEMAVEVDGMALLGGFEHQTDTPLRSDPTLPTRGSGDWPSSAAWTSKCGFLEKPPGKPRNEDASSVSRRYVGSSVGHTTDFAPPRSWGRGIPTYPCA